MTNLKAVSWPRLALAANVLAIGASLYAADQITQITLVSKELYPESITSLKDGTLFVGSLGHGSVLRIPPGKMAPEIFIQPGANGLGSVLGVTLPYDSSAAIRTDIAARGTKGFEGAASLGFGRPVGARHWLQESNPSERWKWDVLFQDLPPVKGTVDPSALPLPPGVIPLKEVK